MMFDSSFVYGAFAFIMAAMFFLIVPKSSYKTVMIYGIIFGGLLESIMVTTLSYLKFIKYSNLGMFQIGGTLSSWTPITWTFLFGLFFYLLPVRKFYLVPYVASFGLFTYAVGIVFENFGIYQYLGFYRYAAPFVYLVWYSAAAWVYIRNSKTIPI